MVSLKNSVQAYESYIAMLNFIKSVELKLGNLALLTVGQNSQNYQARIDLDDETIVKSGKQILIKFDILRNYYSYEHMTETSLPLTYYWLTDDEIKQMENEIIEKKETAEKIEVERLNKIRKEAELKLFNELKVKYEN